MIRMIGKNIGFTPEQSERVQTAASQRGITTAKFVRNAALAAKEKRIGNVSTGNYCPNQANLSRRIPSGDALTR